MNKRALEHLESIISTSVFTKYRIAAPFPLQKVIYKLQGLGHCSPVMAFLLMLNTGSVDPMNAAPWKK